MRAGIRRSGTGRTEIPQWPKYKIHIALVVAILAGLLAGLAAFPAPALAQEGTPPAPTNETDLAAPDQVDVQPLAQDTEIRDRLLGILQATGWFQNPDVRVQEGVVFLSGSTGNADYKKWAGGLARSTQDVAAVVNQIIVTQPPVWDFTPSLTALRDLGRRAVRTLPLIGFNLLILAVFILIARLAVSLTRKSMKSRLMNPLLVNVIARAIGILIFLIGLYAVFYVSGLTNAALTILGGTGLLGIILGIAFQDITENFLASILLSVQNPFRTGDLVEISGVRGFVQMLTTRATVLMTLDGNHVQIPNSTVYKSNIYNYTSNPNRRVDFLVGIGFDDSISAAQEIALKVLAEHPAVLHDPEPWVLVDNLGAATVNLRIYFWLDGTQYSHLKVRSSVIRLVKRAFMTEGISMPDEAREMVFPEGVPVRMVPSEARPEEEAPTTQPMPPSRTTQAEAEPATISTDAEGGLRSEAGEIQEQARKSRKPEEGENLLEPSSDA